MENMVDDRSPFKAAYIRSEEFWTMYTHCRSFADQHEVLGLLIGDRFEWTDHSHTRIFYAITGPISGTSVHVQFKLEGIADVMGQYEELRKSSPACPICEHQMYRGICSPCSYMMSDLKVVGWYHSHPGLSAFLSGTDKETQRKYFNLPHHVAVVIDPNIPEAKVWRNSKNGTKEIELLIY
jgi:proteasome lid subunit RPN8/RPN11